MKEIDEYYKLSGKLIELEKGVIKIRKHKRSKDTEVRKKIASMVKEIGNCDVDIKYETQEISLRFWEPRNKHLAHKIRDAFADSRVVRNRKALTLHLEDLRTLEEIFDTGKITLPDCDVLNNSHNDFTRVVIKDSNVFKPFKMDK